ncbi:hypothetical protein P4S72_00710 [Vibrio sp. PP-XX7]
MMFLTGYIAIFFHLRVNFVSRDMVRIGANLGNIEMLHGGVTTYADMYYFEDEVAKTVDTIGMCGPYSVKRLSNTRSLTQRMLKKALITH